MNLERNELLKPVPPHKIHLQKKPHTMGECYHPKKFKEGVHCVGDQFDYVVPWEVKKRAPQILYEE